MYLSRLILNPQSRQVQREMSNIYQMHRTIMSAFPDNLSKEERVLFRLEVDNQNTLRLLVQSQSSPNWDFLSTPPKNYLLPYSPDDDIPNPAVTEFDLSKSLHPNQTLAFRLRANPTIKKDRPGEKQGHRVGIYDEAGQIDWLKHKADLGGFRVLNVRTSQEGKRSDTIYRQNSAAQKLELLAVQFDGLLQVVDPIKVIETIANGIGSGKGFGFGLLSLARV
jgi:CRISPR system Cascade subunit CasE